MGIDSKNYLGYSRYTFSRNAGWKELVKLTNLEVNITKEIFQNIDCDLAFGE